METNIVSQPFSCILHIQNCSITRGGLPVTLEGRGVTMLERALDVKCEVWPHPSHLCPGHSLTLPVTLKVSEARGRARQLSLVIC